MMFFSEIFGAVAVVALSTVAVSACAMQGGEPDPPKSAVTPDEAKSGDDAKLAKATFGAGCFWCVEAVFQRLEGVKKVVSGYSGGKVGDPTYKQICTGTTGHAEVIQITYDPEVVTFDSLLEVFFMTHDPTQLNRQGADVGTQYRSVVFWHDDEQKQRTEYYKKKLDEAGAFERPIVTEIAKFEKFWPAEKYHQNYFDSNPNQGYCRMVIAPKVEKFEKVFADKLKPTYDAKK